MQIDPKIKNEIIDIEFFNMPQYQRDLIKAFTDSKDKRVIISTSRQLGKSYLHQAMKDFVKVRMVTCFEITIKGRIWYFATFNDSSMKLYKKPKEGQNSYKFFKDPIPIISFLDKHMKDRKMYLEIEKEILRIIG